jgi:hypothetical protein
MGEVAGLPVFNMDTLTEELEALKAEHAALKRRLADFQTSRFLTPQEQLERRRLQKLKLIKKDRIVLLEYRIH